MSHQAQNSNQETRTLWMGDIDTWMDESTVTSYFQSSAHLTSVKIIRDKNTGQPAGYGFLEFATHEAAKAALQTYNNTVIPGTHKNFRLNWGVYGGNTKTSYPKPQGPPSSSYSMQGQIGTMTQTAAQDFSIYAGDLDPQVTDKELFDFFALKYKSVLGAKVIIDGVSKSSKGYGFVKFSNLEESQKALQEMSGANLRGRRIKTSNAYVKSNQQDQNASLNNVYSNLGMDQKTLATMLYMQQLYGLQDLASQQYLNQLPQYSLQQQLLLQQQQQLQLQYYLQQSQQMELQKQQSSGVKQQGQITQGQSLQLLKQSQQTQLPKTTSSQLSANQTEILSTKLPETTDGSGQQKLNAQSSTTQQDLLQGSQAQMYSTEQNLGTKFGLSLLNTVQVDNRALLRQKMELENNQKEINAVPDHVVQIHNMNINSKYFVQV